MSKPKYTPVTDAEAIVILQRTKEKDALEPRAKIAYYNNADEKLVVELRNGVELRIPSRYLQGVAGAPPELIAAVKVTPSGYGLHWEELDADLTVPGLASGIFGSKTWRSEIARQMGKRTSKRKTISSRANGAKGGRPQKKVAV